MRNAAFSAKRREGGRSLAVQLLVLQALLLAVVIATSTAIAVREAQRAVRHNAEVRATAIIETLADSPLVIDAVTGPDPTAVLQPYVERVRGDTGATFITVFARDRTRYTHPNPAEIGQPFVGTIAPALAGHIFTETYTGTLGPSVRATGPIVGPDGRVVALVSAGTTLDTIGADLTRALPGIVGTGLVTLA
ncbi:MAG TPA: histidine kinase, partial [Blastococcus sp.]